MLWLVGVGGVTLVARSEVRYSRELVNRDRRPSVAKLARVHKPGFPHCKKLHAAS
jgi:hypothetical protein